MTEQRDVSQLWQNYCKLHDWQPNALFRRFVEQGDVTEHAVLESILEELGAKGFDASQLEPYDLANVRLEMHLQRLLYMVGADYQGASLINYMLDQALDPDDKDEDDEDDEFDDSEEYIDYEDDGEEFDALDEDSECEECEDFDIDGDL